MVGKHGRRLPVAGLIVGAMLAVAPRVVQAQDEAPSPAAENKTAGEFTPGTGFEMFQSDLISLNLSFYGLARYLNQLGDQSFTDHLGRTQIAKTRNDIQWHRTFVWLSGFFLVPDFRYTITIWSLPTTQQTLVFGNLRYRVGPALELGVGIGPNLGSRSMQGLWPYFLSSDRQMADEFFRPGFTGSFWITGEIPGHLRYAANLGNNISQLGTVAANDTRNLATSASLTWLPTTNEFGPRGGFVDFEDHAEVATRFGVSVTRTREDRYSQIGNPPNNTQIRVSDGLLLFDTGTLADGVTVQRATYGLVAVDAGIKYRGLHLQAEYYFRRLWSFVADGPIPETSIFDHGFYLQASHMVVPETLALYATTSLVFDQFDRFPWEAGVGLQYYPSHTRSWRLNLHALYVDRSPAGSQFGFYVGGQSGPVISIGTDFLF